MKYENDSDSNSPAEFREAFAEPKLDFPVPTEPLKSWAGMVDPDAVLEFSRQQLQRFWSDPEFVRRREARRIHIPFEM